MRLNQFLAKAGMVSRRGADDLIRNGMVLVNGQVGEVGMDVDPEADKIELVDEKSKGRANRVKIAEGQVYLVLNKPRGYTTTVRDKFAQRTVMSLVPRQPRTFPVGRLDRDSEGLLLFTNDGDLANRLMHPQFHIAKTYHVWVRGNLNDEALSRLQGGIRLEDGVAKAKVKVLREEKDQFVLEFILHQGMNRQIRRMCEAVQLQVGKLVRMKIGRIPLGDLPRGSWRYLTEMEIKSLRQDLND